MAKRISEKEPEAAESSRGLHSYISNQLLLPENMRWYDPGEYQRVFGAGAEGDEPQKGNLLEKLGWARRKERLEELRSKLSELESRQRDVEQGKVHYPETLQLPEIKEKIQKIIDEIKKLKNALKTDKY